MPPKTGASNAGEEILSSLWKIQWEQGVSGEEEMCLRSGGIGWMMHEEDTIFR
jgi:hypothetical protein